MSSCRQPRTAPPEQACLRHRHKYRNNCTSILWGNRAPSLCVRCSYVRSRPRCRIDTCLFASNVDCSSPTSPYILIASSGAWFVYTPRLVCAALACDVSRCCLPSMLKHALVRLFEAAAKGNRADRSPHERHELHQLQTRCDRVLSRSGQVHT